MTSRFHGIVPPPGPVVDGFAITPSDATNLPENTRGLLVGTAGNVAVIFVGSATQAPVTLQNLAAGVVHPLAVKRVLATGTTAANIIGLV